MNTSNSSSPAVPGGAAKGAAEGTVPVRSGLAVRDKLFSKELVKTSGAALTMRRAGAMLPLVGERERGADGAGHRACREGLWGPGAVAERGWRAWCGTPSPRVWLWGELRSRPAGGWGFRRKDRYSWLEDYLGRLEGKKAHHEYYARLEQAVLL